MDSTTTSAKDGWLTAWEENRFFCRQVAKVEYFKSCSWQKAIAERPLLLNASSRASRCSFRTRRRPRQSIGTIAEGGSIKVVEVIDHHLPPLRPFPQQGLGGALTSGQRRAGHKVVVPNAAGRDFINIKPYTSVCIPLLPYVNW